MIEERIAILERKIDLLYGKLGYVYDEDEVTTLKELEKRHKEKLKRQRKFLKIVQCEIFPKWNREKWRTEDAKNRQYNEMPELQEML